ncbi:MAG: hypothetical protein Q8T11_05825 [Elusimicrobiota bacterium]|nr:hypothetical protein [Elusimicrobiota bacterium]
MTTPARFVLAAALLGASAGCVSTAKMTADGEPALSPESRRELAEKVSAGWSEAPRLAARLMMSRYGPPDLIGSSRMLWHGNGPWKRTIVRDLPRPYARADEEEQGIIEQAVAYNLTPEQVAGVSPFSPRLTFDSARMEMTSRSDSEEVNFLRLNLANDVLMGVITVPEASDVFAKTLKLEAAGRSVPYMKGLAFGPGRPAASPTPP